MPIKKNNMNMGILRGDIPLKSVMIGTKCVYGFDFTAFKLMFPSVSKGSGLYIEVNGVRKLIDPINEGALTVHFNDEITVRTYAKEGYQNPVSTVFANGIAIDGVQYSISYDGISIVRSTTYSFTVKGDSAIHIEKAIPVPKVNIRIDKDAQVDQVSFYYTKGAYEYSGLDTGTFETTEHLLATTESSVEMYGYNKISTRLPFSEAKEGYKIVSTSKNFSGLLTSDNQCTVAAVSQAGTRVSIVCPPVPVGVTSYALSMVSSEYSKNLNNNTYFYQSSSNPSQASVELSQRDNNQYFFYKGDTIHITAKRKQGYKLPSLGRQGDITPLVTSKQIVLTDENVLVVESGEQGIPVQIVNQQSSFGNALLDVKSEYADASYKVRSPQIYVGDEITVPLSPSYRVGTRYNRKPGVGFSADSKILADITFTSAAKIKVPDASVITVNLQQGAQRTSIKVPSLKPVAIFSRLTNISPMNIKYDSIVGDSYTVNSAFGPEEYYLETFDMTYSCKRYLMDAITSKFIKVSQYNVPSRFNYSYTPEGRATTEVIAGEYNINSDGKGVTLTVSKYDTNWVANSSDQAKLIPRTIRI